MNILDYRGIVKKVLINGSLNGDMRTFFNELAKRLIIKEDDMKPDHPLKLARIEAKMNECRRIQERIANGLPVAKEDVIMVKSMTINMDASRSKKPIKRMVSNVDGTLFIICGDSGFGCKSHEYYMHKLEKVNKILAYNNAYVIFVRGNFDDPSYFDGKTIDMSNLKAVPDYTVIQTDKSNILCVGGAISPDRVWKRKQEERISQFNPKTQKKMYWEKEGVIYDKAQLDEIVSSGIKIDTVVSHTAPSFVSPQELIDVDSWGSGDKDLFEDTFNERVALDKVFEILRDSDSRPNVWFYSHFDINAEERRSKTIFKSIKGLVNTEDWLRRFEANERENRKSKNGFNMGIDPDDDFEGFDIGEADEEDGMELEGGVAPDENPAPFGNPFEGGIGPEENPAHFGNPLEGIQPLNGRPNGDGNAILNAHRAYINANIRANYENIAATARR